MIELSDRSKKFIKDNKNLLIDNDFKSFFMEARGRFAKFRIAEFVKFFIECGIPVSDIVNAFDTLQEELFEDLVLDVVVIPDTIRYIQPFTFHNCTINTVRFPKSFNPQDIGGKYAFSVCDIKKLILPESCNDIPAEFFGLDERTKVEYY